MPFESPLAVWITAAGATIVALITAVGVVSKSLGKVGEDVSKWTANRRRTAAEVEDADHAEQRRQIESLAKANESKDQREQRHQQEISTRDWLIYNHLEWDRDRMAGTTPVPPPPPLFPSSASSAPRPDEDIQED